MDGQQRSPVREGAVTGYMLATASGERFSPWLVISGVLGVLGMAGYLWRGHPRLRRSFKQAPLGSEVQPPPTRPSGPGRPSRRVPACGRQVTPPRHPLRPAR